MNIFNKVVSKIRSFFIKPTNYAPQVLSEKQKSIIDALDSYLVEKCTASTSNTNLLIKTTKIALFFQHYGVGMLLGHMRAAITTEGYGYVPRSIALVVDPDGTWSFYFAVRTTDAGVDDITAELFSNALERTNSAR